MAPRILSRTFTDSEADEAMTRSSVPDTPTLILLRNLQGQIDVLEARLDALEAP